MTPTETQLLERAKARVIRAQDQYARATITADAFLHAKAHYARLLLIFRPYVPPIRHTTGYRWAGCLRSAGVEGDGQSFVGYRTPEDWINNSYVREGDE